MNRQPFMFNGSTNHWYDEDIDRRENLSNGITLRYLVNKNMKRPKLTTFKPHYTNGNNFVGSISKREGFTLFLRGTLNQCAEIKFFKTEAQALELARIIIPEIFP